MLGRTHMATGIAVGMGVVTYTGIIHPDSAALFCAGCAVGTLLPDIDTEESTIGRLLFPIAKAINKVFGHRYLFHSPIFLLGLLALGGCGTYLLANMAGKVVFYGIILGYAIHLLEDLIADKGIPLLYPFKKKKYGIRMVKTGGIIDNFLCLISWCIIFYFFGNSIHVSTSVIHNIKEIFSSLVFK